MVQLAKTARIISNQLKCARYCLSAVLRLSYCLETDTCSSTLPSEEVYCKYIFMGVTELSRITLGSQSTYL
jgi:hypothetical protein